MKQYLVLDIGGTFIKYALMGEDGSFLENGKVPSPMDSLESLLDAVAAVGEKFRGRYEGAAVSMPGNSRPPDVSAFRRSMGGTGSSHRKGTAISSSAATRSDTGRVATPLQ